jgi:hypothetical protein
MARISRGEDCSTGEANWAMWRSRTLPVVDMYVFGEDRAGDRDAAVDGGEFS